MEVTEAMIEAGLRAWWKTPLAGEETITAIYTAMRALEPRASSAGVVERAAKAYIDATVEIILGKFGQLPQGFSTWDDAPEEGREMSRIAMRAALNAAAPQSQPSSNEARLQEALENIASTDRAFVDAHGTDGAFERLIDRARAALSNEGNG